MMTHKTLPASIESSCWTEGVYDQRSLGGCPPLTDETGASKLQGLEDEGCVEIIDDNGVLSNVEWVPEFENSDDDVVDYPEYADTPGQFFDYCFRIDLIATKDDLYS